MLDQNLQTILETPNQTPIIKYYALRALLLLYTGARKFSIATNRSLNYFYSPEGIKALSAVLEKALNLSFTAEHDTNIWKLIATIMQMYFLIASNSGP